MQGKRILRERSDGVYRCLSADPAIANRQRQARQGRIREDRAGLATDLHIILGTQAIVEQLSEARIHLEDRMRVKAQRT